MLLSHIKTSIKTEGLIKVKRVRYRLLKFKDSRSNADDISGRLEDMDEPLSYLSRIKDAYTPKSEMEVP